MARRRPAAGFGDLFPLLIAELAAELCAVPAEAWTEGGARSGGSGALAERLTQLVAARAALRDEDDERATKRGG